MIFVAAKAFSQNQLVKPGKIWLLQTAIKPPVSSSFLITPVKSLPPLKPLIAPDYYVTQLGFFCKKEMKLEKATKIPFRFRLGSIEDCDRMEGKYRKN